MITNYEKFRFLSKTIFLYDNNFFYNYPSQKYAKTLKLVLMGASTLLSVTLHHTCVVGFRREGSS